VDEELTEAWRAELERRLADEPAPGERWLTGDELIAKLRKRNEEDANRPRDD
jgi:hypothetical protein